MTVLVPKFWSEMSARARLVWLRETCASFLGLTEEDAEHMTAGVAWEIVRLDAAARRSHEAV